MKGKGAFWAIILLFGAGCGGQSAAIPTLAVLPSITPDWTATPTELPSSTPSPVPSDTATLLPTVTPSETITSTPAPTATIDSQEQLQADANALADGLALLAGGRNIDSVHLADGRDKGGERAILILYLTTESTEAGYVDEWLDIFSAAAATIRANDIDADSVTLVAGSPTGQATGTLTISVADLLAFHRGEISRADFLSRLDVVTF